jgi:hypothetical protein
MSSAAIAKMKRPPKPRDQSVRGTYELFSKDQVRDACRKSDWRIFGVRLVPDLFRVCGSASKAAVLAVVAMHTSGGVYGMDNKGLKIRKAGNRSKYSCNLTTSDLAKITGYSKRQILKSLSSAKREGFLLQKGQTGADAVQFALDLDAMEKAPNALDPEERFASVRAAEAARALAGGQVSDAEEDAGEGDPESEANEKRTRCRTQRPHLGVVIGPGRGPQTVAEFDNGTGGTRRLQVESDVAAETTITIAPDGDIVLTISARKEAASPAPPAEPAVDASERLSEQLVVRGLTSATDYIRDILTDLGPVPVDYFLAEVDRQIEKSHSARKRYKSEWLRSTARDAKGKWDAEHKLAAKYPPAPPPEPPLLCNLEKVLSYIEGAAAAIEPKLPIIAEELRSIAETVRGEDYNPERVDSLLLPLETWMLRLAKEQLSPDESKAILAEVDQHIAGYRTKMTAENLTHLAQQYFDRELLKRTGLPRLGLFYMEGKS